MLAKGIPTEQLEGVSVFERQQSFRRDYQEMKKQRDELLAALKGLESEFRKIFPIYYYAEPWAHDSNIALKVAQVAIAKSTA